MLIKKKKKKTGAMFNSHPKEGETPSFKGSAMMLLAENEEEARKLLENDVYTRNGVWDIENVQIIPVRLFLSGKYRTVANVV
jgi:uncharacterized protein